MTTESLWGDLDNLEKVVFPDQILEQQGELLKKSTRNILFGDTLRVHRGDSEQGCCFSICGRYLPSKYPLLFISSDIRIYPVALENLLTSEKTTCANEAQLLRALASLFQSHEVRNLLSALHQYSVRAIGKLIDEKNTKPTLPKEVESYSDHLGSYFEVLQREWDYSAIH